MADTAVLSSLEADAFPKIIVTQPSPSKRDSSEFAECVYSEDSSYEESLDFHQNDDGMGIQGVPPAPVIEIKSSEAECLPLSSSGEKNADMPKHDFISNVPEQTADPLGMDSSEELLSPTQLQAFQCNPSVSDEPSAALRVDILPEETEPSNTEHGLWNTSGGNRTQDRLRWLCYRWSEFTESKWWAVLWLLLMALPISAGYMGARYLNKCSMSPSIPTMVFTMGITGVIMLTAIVISIIHSEAWEVICQPCLFIIAPSCALILLLLFCTEFMHFLKYTPSFDVLSPMFCHPTFYNFTYWMNFTTIALMLLPCVYKVMRYLILRSCSH